MSAEFAGNLSLFLEYGHVLEIQAKTLKEAKYFHIDVCTAKSAVNPKADIGLRFSCYFDEIFIRRNTRIKDEWGKAEIGIGFDGNLKNPIKPGEFFKLVIACSNHMFYITVNERPFCTFKYRFALELLRCLEVNGDIEKLKSINHRVVFPLAWPPPKMCNYAENVFTHDVPKKFNPGHVVVITARCFGCEGAFHISFYAADLKEILFHLSVRYNEGYVVRNTRNINGHWVKEERYGGFPFVFGKGFKFAIAFAKSDILIAVDGKRFCSFAYRDSSTYILENITGFWNQCLHGLQMHINGIDHIQMADGDCENFETYTEFDSPISV